MTKLSAWGLTICFAAALVTVPLRAREHKSYDSKKKAEPRVLDINRASAKDFEGLPGIGPKLAGRIVAYREKHGPFRRVEDLLAVRGLGEGKWKAIRPYLRLEDRRDGKNKDKQAR